MLFPPLDHKDMMVKADVILSRNRPVMAEFRHHCLLRVTMVISSWSSFSISSSSKVL